MEAVGYNCSQSIVPEENREEEEVPSNDFACILTVLEKKEERGERREDYVSRIEIQEREEVLEGMSSDYYDNGKCEGSEEVWEERSTDSNHIVTESNRQEEEEVRSTPIWKDPVVCPCIAEYVSMQFPWEHFVHASHAYSSLGIRLCFLTTPFLGHFVYASPNPFFLSIFMWRHPVPTPLFPFKSKIG